MFATLVLAGSLAAPVPKVKSAEPYFSTTLGTTLVMECEHEGRKWLATQEVTKVEKSGEGWAVTIEWLSEKKPYSQVYEVTSAKVMRVDQGERRCTLFDRSPDAGKGWTLEVKVPGRPSVTNTFTVGQEEEVEVPAGKYKAIPVVERLSGGDVNTQWYAAGIGVVKCKCEGSGGERTDVLKSFTHGKDAKK